MNDKRYIGSHIRIDQSLQETLEQISSLQMTAIQFFLFRHHQNRYLRITKEDKTAVKEFKKKCPELYAHSSYWINLAHGNQEHYTIAERLLHKELLIAEKLGLSGLVIHPGSYKGHPRGMPEAHARQRALEQIARLLNRIFKKKSSVSILFENTTCPKKTIGSNLDDFYDLKQLLEAPEKLEFCIDFAHAYAYGYDIMNTESFIDILEKKVGLHAIKLLHVHDASEPGGSYHDRHALLGEGNIGIEALKALTIHEKLRTKSIILELPKTTIETIEAMLESVKSWQISNN